LGPNRCLQAALKIVPTGKWIYFFLGLMPMTMCLASSLSADAMNIAVSFLITAFFLRSTRLTTTISVTWYLKLLILSIVVVLSKQTSVLLIFLYFMLPTHRFGPNRRYWSLTTIYFVVCLGAIGCWTWLNRHNPISSPHVIPAEKIAYILSHPIEFVGIIINTATHNFRGYLYTFVGIFGWMDTRLPSFFSVMYIGVLIIVSFIYHIDESESDWRERGVMGIIFLTGFFVIITILYIFWSPGVTHLAEGVQGRYLIPFSPLFFLMIRKKLVKMPIEESKMCFLAAFIVILSLGYSVVEIIRRFYLFSGGIQ